MNIELGKKYREPSHGVEGIATAEAHFLFEEDKTRIEWKGTFGEINEKWILSSILVLVKPRRTGEVPPG